MLWWMALCACECIEKALKHGGIEASKLYTHIWMRLKENKINVFTVVEDNFRARWKKSVELDCHLQSKWHCRFPVHSTSVIVIILMICEWERKKQFNFKNILQVNHSEMNRFESNRFVECFELCCRRDDGTHTHVSLKHKVKQPHTFSIFSVKCAIQAENNQQKCKYFFYWKCNLIAVQPPYQFEVNNRFRKLYVCMCATFVSV